MDRRDLLVSALLRRVWPRRSRQASRLHLLLQESQRCDTATKEGDTATKGALVDIRHCDIDSRAEQPDVRQWPANRRPTPFASSSLGYCSEPRLAFNCTVVLRYRIHLEQRNYAPATINLRLAAVRRVAYEAADAGPRVPNLRQASAV
jgi:hypothetical protein